MLPKIYLITNKEISVKKQLIYLKELRNCKNIIIQVRMPHLDDSSLIPFIEEIKNIVNNDIKILINNRIDIMEKLNLDGVHFKDKKIDIDLTKYKNKIFSKSTHSIKSIKDAIKNNIDFVTYGPVFYTKSKEKYGKPLGFNALKKEKLDIPIFALGGINFNIIKYLDFDIFYGISAIGLFSNKDIRKNIEILKKYIK